MSSPARPGIDPGANAHDPAADEVRAVLRDAATVRSRCHAILAAVAAGDSALFRIDRDRLDAVAERVERVTLAAYPTLQIPFHSRWRHFEAGAVDRKAGLDARLAGRSVADQARARIDLTVVSVLLDAGAGPDWRFDEPGTGLRIGRSEGLGLASWHAFLQGLFSDDPGDPLRADAAALRRLDAAALGRAFQVGPGNPLVGLEGRVALLNRLGDALEARAGDGLPARPGSLFDRLAAADAAGRPRAARVAAAAVLREVLDASSSIWLTGATLHGVPLGDAWRHPQAGGSGPTAGWVPFHKLSQWMSYSLLEPLAWAGLALDGLDALTGLPEYRNGGLLLDAGVIVPRDPAATGRRWRAADPFIVEWRALTVALLDELAPRVRQRLGRGTDSLPLACILEGGTWAAGRQIAAEQRPGGPPPLDIESDGTVF
ncbi:DUF1688 family protein [Piscinibacter sakaiensis]|uniref:Putative pyrimidine-degrading protein n=1 Tax=Piscinibacter sakaiensis TaxID=1547922 RepID=A0A0K8P7K2_PISS1|nr:DUF1688 family protein [Piscinibacter sakaiensis]GAP38638.1 putative pyrimidine-degrading protein [Piscinibacter sakaiensis]